MSKKVAFRQWLGLIGISLLAFTIFLDITIVANALPAIRVALDASDTQLQWLSNTIYIALCALMATVGRLGDIYGLRKVFYTSMIIMALSSFACGISTSINQLIFFRAIQGITLASITITAALIAHNFPENYQSKAMAVFSAVAGLGLALGPVIGGFLVELLSWRWVFFINVPIVAIGITICAFNVTEHKNHHKTKVDWLGAIFFIITAVSLVTTIMEGDMWGWNSTLSNAGFVIAVIASICFVLTELNAKAPIMPFPLLANSVFVSAALACLTCGMFIAILLFYNPLYLQNILKFSAIYSGWLLLSTSILYVLMSPVAGFITTHLSPKIGTWLVSLLLMVSAVCHAFFGLQPNMTLILIGFITFGMAWGTVNVPPVVAVMQTMEKKHAGVMLGSLWTFFNVGSALGLALLGLLFRYVAHYTLLQNLSSVSNHFTSDQFNLLAKIVAEPESILTVVKQFPADVALQIIPAYQAAFVHAFNVVAWVMFAIAAFTFLITIIFMRNVKIRKDVEPMMVI